MTSWRSWTTTSRPMAKNIDPEKQFAFIQEQADEWKKRASDPVAIQLGIPARNLEQAIDGLLSILERRKGALDQDDDGRDALYALGYDPGDRCGEPGCGRKDCESWLALLAEREEEES